MTVAALPMVALYLATIGVVKIIERNERKAQQRDRAG
jgi:Sec-independent protein secretion pathway component TatC